MDLKDELISNAVFDLPFLHRVWVALELVFGAGSILVEARTPTENVVGSTPKGTAWTFKVETWWDRLMAGHPPISAHRRSHDGCGIERFRRPQEGGFSPPDDESEPEKQKEG